jgi:hypothetical protein
VSKHPYGLGIFPQHAELLRASAISPEVARQRNYQSVDTKARLDSIDVPKAHRNVPGLLIPVYGPESANGEAATWQYRPDHPNFNGRGKPVKYVTAMRGLVVDVPPAVKPHLGDPDRPLWITEGSRKADSAVSHGIDCLSLLGVWNWRGTNDRGGSVALAAWEFIALKGRDVFVCFDSDVMVKATVRIALRRLTGFLELRKAAVFLVMLPEAPDGEKTGLDDYLAAGGTVADLEDAGRIIRPGELDDFTRNGAEPKPAPYMPPAKRSLAETVDVFRRWLYLDDPAPVHALAAAIVANRAMGDPVWLLIVSAPSTGKTEMLSAASRLPYVHPVATLTASALLSGTSKREQAKDATGGVLRQVGDFGVLLAKDFTSVLAQNRDTRGEALAALREVYDGSWNRPMGTDGGRVLSWSGKCGLLGGVTPAFDRYHAVVSTLGDRFLLLRLPDIHPGRAAVMALTHRGREVEMRAELAEALGGLVEHADPTKVNRELTADETSGLVDLAVFTARARTGVDRDGYSREVLYLPQVEGPGRLVTAYARMLGGLEAIGCDEATAWSVLGRIAVDCLPAVRGRLARVLLAAGSPLRTSAVAASLGMATRTAHPALEDMALVGLVDRDKVNANDNAPDLWAASAWLRRYWPPDLSQKCTYPTPTPEGELIGGPPKESAIDDDTHPSVHLWPRSPTAEVDLRGTSPKVQPSTAEPRWDWS